MYCAAEEHEPNELPLVKPDPSPPPHTHPCPSTPTPNFNVDIRRYTRHQIMRKGSSSNGTQKKCASQARNSPDLMLSVREGGWVGKNISFGSFPQAAVHRHFQRVPPTTCCRRSPPTATAITEEACSSSSSSFLLLLLCFSRLYHVSATTTESPTTTTTRPRLQC